MLLSRSLALSGHACAFLWVFVGHCGAGGECCSRRPVSLHGIHALKNIGVLSRAIEVEAAAISCGDRSE